MKSSETTKDAIGGAARRLRWAVIVAMLAMAALYVAGRLGLELGDARVESRSHGPDLPAARLLSDLGLVMLLVALFRLTQMLGHIAAGETFSAAVIARFRSFALWLLLMALLGLLAPALGALLAQRSNPHELQLAINFRDIVTVGVTLVLFLLARLLERARGLEEEVREFV